MAGLWQVHGGLPSDYPSLSNLMAPAGSIAWVVEALLLVQMGLFLSRRAKNWVVLVSLLAQLFCTTHLPLLHPLSHSPSLLLLPCQAQAPFSPNYSLVSSQLLLCSSAHTCCFCPCCHAACTTSFCLAQSLLVHTVVCACFTVKMTNHGTGWVSKVCPLGLVHELSCSGQKLKTELEFCYEAKFPPLILPNFPLHPQSHNLTSQKWCQITFIFALIFSWPFF